ncbi:hypothetical protein Dimus_009687 [Dionaea muscipula]
MLLQCYRIHGHHCPPCHCNVAVTSETLSFCNPTCMNSGNLRCHGCLSNSCTNGLVVRHDQLLITMVTHHPLCHQLLHTCDYSGFLCFSICPPVFVFAMAERSLNRCMIARYFVDVVQFIRVSLETVDHEVVYECYGCPVNTTVHLLENHRILFERASSFRYSIIL